MSKLKLIPFLLGIFLIAAGVFLQNKLNLIQYEETEDIYIPELPETEETEEPDPVPTKSDLSAIEIEKPESVLQGKEYIALAGIDYRKTNQAENSDSMIIVQLNHDTKEIKLVSVFRDTYLKVEDNKYFKCNAAYNMNGPTGFLSMLNRNLDLSITQYASVDFVTMQKLIDAMDGIDVNVTMQEAVEINRFNKETSKVCGMPYKRLEEKDGLQHLDGSQAVTYARIRKRVGDDFGRADRQRKLLSLIFDKAKQIPITKINEIANAILPFITTNIQDVSKYLIPLLSYQITDMKGFPFENTMGYVGNASCVFAIDLEKNVRELHTFLGDVDYEPSNEVKNISDYLRSHVGY